MGKKGGLHKNVVGHEKFNEWHAAVTWVSADAKEAELQALQALFKKCGGDKNFKAIPRAKFMKKFTDEVTVNGEPLVVPDIEALFNAGSIDYDYDTFSLHEFMSLMIVLRGTDADTKLKYMFKLYDTDASGSLSKVEVEKMLNALMATKTEGERKTTINVFMDKFDKNKDGKVHVDELQKALSDNNWMTKYVGKGISTLEVADAAFGKQGGGSRACLVM